MKTNFEKTDSALYQTCGYRETQTMGVQYAESNTRSKSVSVGTQHIYFMGSRFLYSEVIYFMGTKSMQGVGVHALLYPALLGAPRVSTARELVRMLKIDSRVDTLVN